MSASKAAVLRIGSESETASSKLHIVLYLGLAVSSKRLRKINPKYDNLLYCKVPIYAATSHVHKPYSKVGVGSWIVIPELRLELVASFSDSRYIYDLQNSCCTGSEVSLASSLLVFKWP